MSDVVVSFIVMSPTIIMLAFHAEGVKDAFEFTAEMLVKEDRE